MVSILDIGKSREASLGKNIHSIQNTLSLRVQKNISGVFESIIDLTLFDHHCVPYTLHIYIHLHKVRD